MKFIGQIVILFNFIQFGQICDLHRLIHTLRRFAVKEETSKNSVKHYTNFLMNLSMNSFDGRGGHTLESHIRELCFRRSRFIFHPI